jgi:hypothetical protein
MFRAPEALSVVPAGTPVVEASGKPVLDVGVGVGVAVTVGVGVGVAVTVGVGVGVAVTVGVGVGVTVGSGTVVVGNPVPVDRSATATKLHLDALGARVPITVDFPLVAVTDWNQ